MLNVQLRTSKCRMTRVYPKRYQTLLYVRSVDIAARSAKETKSQYI